MKEIKINLSLPFFCFQQRGEMSMSTAVPCICACCTMWPVQSKSTVLTPKIM